MIHLPSITVWYYQVASLMSIVYVSTLAALSIISFASKFIRQFLWKGNGARRRPQFKSPMRSGRHSVSGNDEQLEFVPEFTEPAETAETAGWFERKENGNWSLSESGIEEGAIRTPSGDIERVLETMREVRERRPILPSKWGSYK